MRIGALVCRSVWRTALLGSLLAGCGGEAGINHEDSESAKSGAVFESFVPAADEQRGEDVHSANLSCQGGTLTWQQARTAWNYNSNTQGTYSCNASVPTTSHGWDVSVQPSSTARVGSATIRCNNGTWQWVGGSCDGRVVSTAVANGGNYVCSSSDPVRTKWIGWYVADLKRCPEFEGLEWWVTQYNNNAACHASNNYDGYGTKDTCWRAHFRNGAGNSYPEAQSLGHITSQDEYNACGPLAAYPWSNVLAAGHQCKYRP